VPDVTLDTGWELATTSAVQQGLFFKDLPVVAVPDDFGLQATYDVAVARSDGLVLTHTCQIANSKVKLVSLCSVSDLLQYCTGNKYGKGRVNDLQAHRLDANHLLAHPNLSDRYLVVHFNVMFSLPLEFLKKRLDESAEHWVLKAGHRENLTHRFGNYYSKPVVERTEVSETFLSMLEQRG
jgi:hypothetical protein